MSDHNEHHDPHLAHHFDSRAQQFASVKLGMWAFLATEILMFGGLFCAYAVYRRNNPETFEFGHLLLDSKWGAINTVFLIASSFTMAWAVRTAMLNKQKATSILLGLTLLGGVGFMCIKYVEYSGKFSHGTGPGPYFDVVAYEKYYNKKHAHDDHDHDHHAMTHTAESHAADAMTVAYAPPTAEWATNTTDAAAPPAGLAPPVPASDKSWFASLFDVFHHKSPTPTEVVQSREFIHIYFAMTGLHGIHVLIGMLLIGYILIRNIKGVYGSHNYTAVDVVGLYWHIVDLIWIFLFPLLYLIHT